jgi:hypothetical protein
MRRPFLLFLQNEIPVLRKFFPLDKNYILEEAQLSLENSLLQYMVDYVKVEYLMRNNPLGIVDEMSTRMADHTGSDFRHLHEFYSYPDGDLPLSSLQRQSACVLVRRRRRLQEVPEGMDN